MTVKNLTDPPASRLKVAIVGASGYSGIELLRLLHHHPRVEVTAITSEQHAGQPLTQVFPSLECYPSLSFEVFQAERIAQASSLVFLALPHKTAMEPVAQLIKMGKRVIDLSADYRLRDPALYEQWYHLPHRHPHLLQEAVYGLPELHRERIRRANLIGNPGCYPTGVLLGLLPLFKSEILDPEEILIDAKSGLSGAGRSLSLSSHFVEAHEGLGPYQVGRHRHTPEMEQELSALAGHGIRVSFVPHLVPMSRGILTTHFVRLKKSKSLSELLGLYQEVYSGEPFVRILPEGELSHTHHVRGTNVCEISLASSSFGKRLIVFTALDNLVKGAAGQAIQNMNLMMGYEESLGLKIPGLYP